MNLLMIIAPLFTALHLSVASDAEVFTETEPQTANFVSVDGTANFVSVDGICLDASYRQQLYDYASYKNIETIEACKATCGTFSNAVLVGLHYRLPNPNPNCFCLFTNGYVETLIDKPEAFGWYEKNSGTGPITGTRQESGSICKKNENFNPNDDTQAASFVSVGGKCRDFGKAFYDWVSFKADTLGKCKAICGAFHSSSSDMTGLEFDEGASSCACLFSFGALPAPPAEAVSAGEGMSGSGPVGTTSIMSHWIDNKWKALNCTCLKTPHQSGQASFKLLPKDKELLGQVKGLLRGAGDSVGRDQGEGTEAADPVPIAV